MADNDETRRRTTDLNEVLARKGPSSPTMIHSITCARAEDLIEELLPTRTSWLRRSSEWSYRGQSDSSWPLQPSVFRIVQHRYAGRDESIAAVMRFVPAQVQADAPHPPRHVQRELALVNDFIENLERLGLVIPFDSPRLRSGDAYIGDPCEFPPDELRAIFALAQHYGIPTRLLDWTYKPLVAAYFAAVGVARRRWEEGEQEGNDLVVWAINGRLKHWLRSLDPGVEFVTAPAASNPHLHAQGGRFTLVRYKHANPLAPTEHPPALDALIGAIQPSDVPAEVKSLLPALVKLQLPVTEARSLLRLLSNHQVTAAEVYPGHRGAAEAIKELKWMQWARPEHRS